MNQYQMDSSFDGITWYRLNWNDVDFKDFEFIGNKTNSIEELMSVISESFPNCQLQYEYLGEKKASKFKETIKKKTKRK